MIVSRNPSSNQSGAEFDANPADAALRTIFLIAYCAMTIASIGFFISLRIPRLSDQKRGDGFSRALCNHPCQSPSPLSGGLMIVFSGSQVGLFALCAALSS